MKIEYMLMTIFGLNVVSSIMEMFLSYKCGYHDKKTLIRNQEVHMAETSYLKKSIDYYSSELRKYKELELKNKTEKYEH